MRATTFISSIVATAVLSAVHAADVTVTQEMLLPRTIPAITSLSNDGTGDWTSVGETQQAGFIQERAHLNEDGELVLVDDEGFQYHAVWAASRPVTAATSWDVSFRYIPVPNPSSSYVDAGGWTFVMQKQGATAYGTSSPLLGAPASGAYGILFHRYFLGVRWVNNSNSVNAFDNSAWTHFIATNSYAGRSFTEGIDLNLKKPIDVTIGCTDRVWTVTFRQEGKADAVLTHDFSGSIANNATQYHIGFTGSSSYWGNGKKPMMYQKIANVAGSMDVDVPNFVDAGSAYALDEGTWRILEYSEFVAPGRLLVLDPYTATGNRCFGGVGQTPLYKKLPFSVSFQWACEYGTKGAQGVSFSLVPSNVPQNGSSVGGEEFFYSGDANAGGFYLRPYSNQGFGWHKAGERSEASVPFSNITSGDVMHVWADWNGDNKLIVTIRRNDGTTTIRTNTFDNLPDVFYPAFHGATAKYSDGPTRFIAQNYSMRVLDNPNPTKLGDVVVAGAQEYELSTWSASANRPSAVAGTLSLREGDALTLSPDANGLGGSLAISNVEVRAASSIVATSPCATILSRLSYPVDATLALEGRVLAAADPVTVWCAAGAFRGGRHLLLDATGASGLEGASFALAEGADAIAGDRCRLEWNGETLTLVVKGGFMMTVR